MCAGPRLFDGRSFLLLMLLGLIAVALCPAVHVLSPKTKRRIGLALPPVILLSWFLFQRELVFTDRMSQAFYRSMHGDIVWR